MHSKASCLAALISLANAHFTVTWPESRGFDDDKIVNYPCGGFDSVSNRTSFPLSGGPIQLDMEHTSTNVEVLIALGNDPSGADYHTVLVPTFYEQGPQNFCLGDVTFPGSLNVTEGQNATIQVQTNGDPDGGLYAVSSWSVVSAVFANMNSQCIDITFTSTRLSSSEYSAHCTNSTGVHVSALNTQANANETEAGKGGSGGTSATVTVSSTSSKGLAPQATAFGMVAAGMVGVAGMLAL